MSAFHFTTVLTAAVLLTSPAFAHDFSPHVVSLTQEGDGRYSLHTRWAEGQPRPRLVVPEGCALSPPVLRCRPTPESTAGALAFEGLVPGGAGLVLRLIDDRGAIRERFLNAAQSTFHLPGTGDDYRPADIFIRYVELGVAHIWVGVDHLLFLLMLVFLVSTPRRLALTVSAFTVGHSLTLAGSLLVWAPPAAAVEATIAFSVVLLARDVVLGRQDHFQRHAFAVTLLFGLIHGLGFAGVLKDIGLPPTHTIGALLAFNVGVELGQLAFVAVAWALSTLSALSMPWAGRVAGYATGCVAATWLLARAAALGTGG